jgi:hypothetical protein
MAEALHFSSIPLILLFIIFVINFFIFRPFVFRDLFESNMHASGP